MSISQILGLSPQNVYSMATAAIRSQDSCISQCTNTERHKHITWSFSGLSEKSLRLLEVRFRWAVVGLPAKKKGKDTVRTREAGWDHRASNETFMDRGESWVPEKKRHKGKYKKRARKLNVARLKLWVQCQMVIHSDASERRELWLFLGTARLLIRVSRSLLRQLLANMWQCKLWNSALCGPFTHQLLLTMPENRVYDIFSFRLPHKYLVECIWS